MPGDRSVLLVEECAARGRTVAAPPHRPRPLRGARGPSGSHTLLGHVVGEFPAHSTDVALQDRPHELLGGLERAFAIVVQPVGARHAVFRARRRLGRFSRRSAAATPRLVQAGRDPWISWTKPPTRERHQRHHGGVNVADNAAEKRRHPHQCAYETTVSPSTPPRNWAVSVPPLATTHIQQ